MADSTQIPAATVDFQSKAPASYATVAAYEITIDVTAYAVGGSPRLDSPPATPDATASFTKFVEVVAGREVDILGVYLTDAGNFDVRWDRQRDTLKFIVMSTGTEVADAVDIGEVRLRVMTR